jgi:hypothetical protein
MMKPGGEVGQCDVGCRQRYPTDGGAGERGSSGCKEAQSK